MDSAVVSVSIGDAVLRFFVASLADEQFRLEFGDGHVTAHVFFYVPYVGLPN